MKKLKKIRKDMSASRGGRWEVAGSGSICKSKKKITKDMMFAELIELDSEAGAKLAERGLFCGGCPMARFETIENGALAHGVDVDELLEELNAEGSSTLSMDGSIASRLEGSQSSIAEGSASPETGRGGESE